MTQEECLERFGLKAKVSDLPAIRQILIQETEKEAKSQSLGDNELLKHCSAQLYFGAQVEDSRLIWDAKTASMDSDCSIDVQLLCGAGLEATLSYLRSQSSPAVARLQRAIDSGDFQDLVPEAYARFLSHYYGLS